MKQSNNEIFSIGIGNCGDLKVGKEKSVRHEKGFLGLPKVVKVKMMDTYPHGAPVGGFGAGTIGRSPDGDFNVWHLYTGRHVFENLPACQFSIYQKQGKKSVAFSCSGSPKKGWGMRSFKKYPKGEGKYSAVYPKAISEYSSEKLFMKLTCTQLTPVLPGNYQETSYPLGVYIWRGKNNTQQPIKLSLMMSFENIVGWEVTWPQAAHNSEQCFFIKKPGDTIHQIKEDKKSASLVLSHRKRIEQICMTIPKNKNYIISYQKDFDPASSGGIAWKPFSRKGILNNSNLETNSKRNAGAIAVQVVVLPGMEIEIPFVLAWDYPMHDLRENNFFYRYYTNFFNCNGRNVCKIAQVALKDYKKWEKAIDAWHKPYFKKYDKWFVSFLFNELYYLADGGTIWDAKSGDFGLLECYDYFFYETLDVRFYGSFPLMKFWPKLEMQIMRQFAKAIVSEDPTYTRFWEYNWKIDVPVTEEPTWAYTGPLKVKGACPHDLGSLKQQPLRAMNSYIWRNSNHWKDMNAKFVLLVYRDYVNGGKNISFLKDCWPAVVSALNYLKRMDKDKDGMIENEGFPDQTYDNWPMSGVSAYCGSLWVAALEASVKMGSILKKSKDTKDFSLWLKQSRKIFDQKLWNGTYYDCFEGCSDIFSDQLVGQWYTQLTGLSPIATTVKVKSALKTIYKFNVLTFGNGKMGAVNGRKADGSKCGHEQGDDAWVGTNCFLAGLMLKNGLHKEGWQILNGLYNLIYNEKGYFFRTPEGYRENGDYVGTMYMRPMAIWSIV